MGQSTRRTRGTAERLASGFGDRAVAEPLQVRARIEGVAQTVAQQVEAERGDQQRQAGPHDQPRLDRVEGDRAVSARILMATVIEAYTMMVPVRCGSRCERMIRKLDAPTMRAASTNSFSRSASTCERMMRAG